MQRFDVHSEALYKLQKKIATTFHNYYSSLYYLRDTNIPISDHFNPSQLAEYTNHTALPCITEEEAITSLKQGKCPGMDGFLGAFYMHYCDALSPVLCSLYNKINSNCPFTKQTQEGQITLIAKIEKDHFQCSSYRPISLINVDLIFLAKILAMYLQIVIPS